MLSRLFRFLDSFGASLQSPVLLALRLFWGWQFAQTGWGKLMNLSATAEYFSSLGLPFPFLSAFGAAVVESAGGLLLALGAFSRLASFALLTTMTVAYLTAEKEALRLILSEPDRFTGATPFLFAFASLLVFVFGPGRWSVDSLFHGAPPSPRP